MVVINRITDEIIKVSGVKLLNVDPGRTTNRTVVTFAGSPEEVCEAAFQAVKKAAELIDMSQHHGEHPRMGATDVCPLVPVSGVTMEETIKYARDLAGRIGKELKIPVYCYENAAFKENRRNLATCRQGEYEGLPVKLTSADWKPDFGPAEWNKNTARTGATAVGARNFLIAYNINLNTTSVRRANAVAFDIREKGRMKREGNQLTGNVVRDAAGEPVYEPGLLKGVKAIGWYIEEYGIAQISINITDLEASPLHRVFDTACEQAARRGLRVTGSELVGMVPLKTMLEAGRYFLQKQNRSSGIPEKEILKIAVKSLGLDDLTPFEPDKKIIEYALKEAFQKNLIDLSIQSYADETASESPAPGGGSASALIGALGASLAAMVANLSAHKAGWDNRWDEFSGIAEKAMELQKEMLKLVDEDTTAFNGILEAMRLPKDSDNDKNMRNKAIETATQKAIEVPLQVMRLAVASFDIIKVLVETGLPASASDAGVAAICARSAVMGAFLNVQINSKGIDNKDFINTILTECNEINDKAILKETEIIRLVEERM